MDKNMAMLLIFAIVAFALYHPSSRKIALKAIIIIAIIYALLTLLARLFNFVYDQTVYVLKIFTMGVITGILIAYYFK
jgi:hypothetical protein